MIVCTFQAEPTQSPPLTKGGGPPSLTFESRRISQTQAPSRWLGCRVLRGNVCTKVTTMSRLSKQE